MTKITANTAREIARKAIENGTVAQWWIYLPAGTDIDMSMAAPLGRQTVESLTRHIMACVE